FRLATLRTLISARLLVAGVVRLTLATTPAAVAAAAQPRLRSASDLILALRKMPRRAKRSHPPARTVWTPSSRRKLRMAKAQQRRRRRTTQETRRRASLLAA